MKRLVMLALLLFVPLSVTACSDDDDPTGLETSLNGTWRFSYNNMTGTLLGIPVSCSAAAVDFNLTTTGTTFSGIQVGTATGSCTLAGQTTQQVLSGETIVNGTISGSTITFRLGTLAGQNTATVTGTSMTGTAQWIYALNNQTITLNGQFTAAKR
jgi:hypothetical protein